MRGLIAFCLGLVVVLGSGAAWGAEFEDVGEPEEFSQEEIRGPQTGCEASTQTRIAAGVAPDVCTVDYDIRSEVSGNDPSCDLFAKARAGGSITARLVSTDEGPGRGEGLRQFPRNPESRGTGERHRDSFHRYSNGDHQPFRREAPCGGNSAAERYRHGWGRSRGRV